MLNLKRAHISKTNSSLSVRIHVVHLLNFCRRTDANYVGIFSQLLVIAPDINFMTVTIPVGADNIVGPDKMFTINFNPINSLDSFINGSSVAVTIIESKLLKDQVQSTITYMGRYSMDGTTAVDC